MVLIWLFQEFITECFWYPTRRWHLQVFMKPCIVRDQSCPLVPLNWFLHPHLKWWTLKLTMVRQCQGLAHEVSSSSLANFQFYKFIVSCLMHKLFRFWGSQMSSLTPCHLQHSSTNTIRTKAPSGDVSSPLPEIWHPKCRPVSHSHQSSTASVHLQYQTLDQWILYSSWNVPWQLLSHFGKKTNEFLCLVTLL